MSQRRIRSSFHLVAQHHWRFSLDKACRTETSCAVQVQPIVNAMQYRLDQTLFHWTDDQQGSEPRRSADDSSFHRPSTNALARCQPFTSVISLSRSPDQAAILPSCAVFAMIRSCWRIRHIGLYLVGTRKLWINHRLTSSWLNA